MKRVVSAVVTAMIVLTSSVGLVSRASAATITSNCGSTKRMCIHYNSIPYGLNAEYGKDSGVPSFNPAMNGGDTYLFSAGSQGTTGAGISVWNNAGGARNLHSYVDFRVYFNSNYAGASDLVPAGWSMSLSATKNDNASMAWV